MRRAEAAFSLLEALMGIVLFSVVSMAISKGIAVQLQANTDNEIRSEAVQAAQQFLDKLRAMDPAALPISGQQSPEAILVGERTYTLVAAYCSISSFCRASTTRHIRVSVYYKGKHRYEVDTVFAQLR